MPNHAALICALLYPVQSDAHPREGIERVLTTVIEPQCLDTIPLDYLEAVREALESKEALAALIPRLTRRMSSGDILRTSPARLSAGGVGRPAAPERSRQIKA